MAGDEGRPGGGGGLGEGAALEEMEGGTAGQCARSRPSTSSHSLPLLLSIPQEDLAIIITNTKRRRRSPVPGSNAAKAAAANGEGDGR